MPTPSRPSSLGALAFIATALSALLTLPVAAEKADRTKQIVVEGDKPGTLDAQRQVVVFNGNVAISQGTLLIRAERIEVRDLPNGYRVITAIGVPGRQASYRQKRDKPEESVEGFGDRIEFDGRADTIKFNGNSVVRRLRGNTVADEITGSQITWDNTNELFTVQGGAVSPVNPGGRVRAVLSPRADEAASGASAPAGTALKPSRSLPESKDPR
jgi:lipopolysaccharide export system protein LptA